MTLLRLNAEKSSAAARYAKQKGSFVERYDLLLPEADYPLVKRLVDDGMLVLTTKPTVPGDRPQRHPQDRIYTLSEGVAVVIPDTRTINIGGIILHGEPYRLTSHAYSALVRQSCFQNFTGLNDVLTLMRCPTSTLRQVVEAIEGCVASGLSTEEEPQLIQTSPFFRAAWVPEMTVIRKTVEGYLYVSLAFISRYFPNPAPKRQAVGLDIGLNPVAAAYHSNGDTFAFPKRPLVVPARVTLSVAGQHILDQLLYAHGREACEGVIHHLLRHADRVYSEEIRLTDMSEIYRIRAREFGLNDFHFAWLPQACYRAGIRHRRVPSRNTSTRCPICGHEADENRHGSRFKCGACAFGANAHVVGAANVLYRGWNDDCEAQRLHPWLTPPAAQAE